MNHFSGQSFTGIQKFMESANIQFISDAIYRKYQSSIVVPAVNEVYEESMEQILQEVKSRGNEVAVSLYSLSLISHHAVANTCYSFAYREAIYN